jgi:hypothetical protein
VTCVYATQLRFVFGLQSLSPAAQPVFSVRPGMGSSVDVMDQDRARRVVGALRARNVFAHVKLPHAGITRYGIRVVLPDGREAVWDNDGTAGLEAQIMRNGILVGFVPSIPGSENYGEAEIIQAIAGADYDQPIGRSRPAPPRPAPRGAGPVRPPITLAQRLRGGFRS